MNNKYQIFVSSTYIDLIEARRRIINRILSMDHFPAGMEMFNAENANQWEVIKRTIDSSDYYIVVIGHRYGSIEETSGISYTEKEYDYAVSKGIPVLAFIRDRNTATLPKERESDDKLVSKLAQFINKAQQRMCEYWTDLEDLEAKVPSALYNSFRYYPQTGWIRGNQAASPEMANELARLSKENSELRLELEKYKKNDGIPELSVLFNNSNKLSLIYPETINGLKKVFQYQKITKDKIEEHLLPYITDEEIERFNTKIPTVEEINEFNKKKTEYELIFNHKLLLEISIGNIGNRKSNQIYVDIEFPNGVRVFYEDFLDELSEPDLYIPENPLIKAHKEYMEKINPTIKRISELTKFASIGEMYATSHLYPTYPDMSKIRRLSNSLYYKDQSRSLSIRENTISIYIEDLLHTRQVNFLNKVYIAPLKEGNFLIRYSVMCEQFKEPQNFEVPLIITKKQSGI